MTRINTWFRRTRGAAGLGAIWAVGWAVFGVMIGATSDITPWLPWDAFFKVFDAPLPALAIPGFLGGCIFSVVLSITERARPFDELSMKRFAGWGAVGGLLLSLVPAAMVSTGLATIAEGGLGIWQFTGMIAAPLTLLSAGSAALSLLLARRVTSAPSSAHLEPDKLSTVEQRDETEMLRSPNHVASARQQARPNSVRNLL